VSRVDNQVIGLLGNRVEYHLPSRAHLLGSHLANLQDNLLMSLLDSPLQSRLDSPLVNLLANLV
jgi:hypothetical protein